jgi:hypothetical protein
MNAIQGAVDSPERQVIKQTHEQWIQHPMTQVLLKALKAKQEEFNAKLINTAAVPDIDDKQIRYTAISIRDYEAVITLVKSPLTLATLV